MYVIEEQFEKFGIKCAIVFNIINGARYGYIYIPESFETFDIEHLQPFKYRLDMEKPIVLDGALIHFLCFDDEDLSDFDSSLKYLREQGVPKDSGYYKSFVEYFKILIDIRKAKKLTGKIKKTIDVRAYIMALLGNYFAYKIRHTEK